MTYTEAIDFLYGIRLFGQKLGLETMQDLMRRLGNPERDLRFIHIAGTNGKGSVAAMTHAVLAHAGFRTGLYTSPHLVSFCERFQVNGQPIAEGDAVRLVEQIRPLLERTEPRSPTFFEVVTAMALLYFRECNVEVVSWETGMGGRLDATNIVTPCVSVITNVGYDHMQYLGDTLDKIAAEKAGIIKRGVPVVTGAQDPTVLKIIRQTCATLNSSLTEVRQPLLWETNLAGDYQHWNCATAVAALRATGLPLSEGLIRTGLRQTRWPGRFQVFKGPPCVVLDGAHNAPAAAELAKTLSAESPTTERTLILGVLRDKEVAQVCQTLAPMAAKIFCVPVQNERSSDPSELARFCRNANPQAEVEVHADLPSAFAKARGGETGVVVITGSLFLVGEALARLPLAGWSATAGEKERRLQ